MRHDTTATGTATGDRAGATTATAERAGRADGRLDGAAGADLLTAGPDLLTADRGHALAEPDLGSRNPLDIPPQARTRTAAPAAPPEPTVPSPLRPDDPAPHPADRPAIHWSGRYLRRVFLTDLAVITLAASAGLLANGATGGREPHLAALALIAVWMLALQLFRTRSPRSMAVGANEYKRVVSSTAAAAGVLCTVSVLLGADAFPAVRPHLVLSLPVGLPALMLGRWVWRSWLHRLRLRGVSLSHVVVVGQPADVAYVTRQIERRSAVCYRVVGEVLDEPDDLDPGDGRDTAPAFTRTGRVLEAVGSLGADAVIVAGPLRAGTPAIRTLGWALEPSGTELILVSSLVNVAGPRITMRPVEGLPLMHVDKPRFEGGRHVVKRVLDIVGASAALLLMAPLLAVLAILVRRDSPGGALFSQERTGRHGRPFRMHKFRTMVTTAERDRAALAAQNEGAGPLFKLKDDPRVTRVGAILRRHSLDELPQFWNVLRGEMSLVGPRPPLPDEVAAYQGHTGRRLYIKPGLTGLWQINGRSNLDWEESVRLDLYYVENWSVTGDLMIMWRTFKVMVRPEGAY